MCCCVKNKEYTDAVLVKEHSHPADQTSASVEKCRHSMKTTASTANDKPNQILSSAAVAVPDEVQARLPAAEMIKRVLRRVHAIMYFHDKCGKCGTINVFISVVLIGCLIIENLVNI